MKRQNTELTRRAHAAEQLALESRVSAELNEKLTQWRNKHLWRVLDASHDIPKGKIRARYEMSGGQA